MQSVFRSLRKALDSAHRTGSDSVQLCESCSLVTDGPARGLAHIRQMQDKALQYRF